MFTLLLTLHVLLAIFLIGPLAMIPMTAMRSIRKRDASAVGDAARQTTVYGLASIVVFLLGFGVAGSKSNRFSLGDPWITISMTLYVIALVLVLAVLVPDLRRAAKLLTAGVPDAPKPAKGDEPEETVSATASELAEHARLSSVRARVSAIGGLVALLFIAIIVLMVTKPFS
ncbi:DUF2269 family protein [Actinocatenispora rupis]|uniref:Uncharacterized protein n=1 Tax=Actinocatenispora rupis TaxID=519421 RepID=A0A8J3NB92_9ACTN|nr:DUF2269 family protein [Actinocatenispora rupis]GID10417.1 hypothetical protein Aru02nite_13060 [Actinocatenispora rupis]